MRHMAPMKSAASRRISRGKRREAKPTTTGQPPMSYGRPSISKTPWHQKRRRGSERGRTATFSSVLGSEPTICSDRDSVSPAR